MWTSDEAYRWTTWHTWECRTQRRSRVTSLLSCQQSLSLASFKIQKSPLCVRAGRQTQGKVPLTYRNPDKEAARVRSRWRCRGSESQRFPLRLPPPHAYSRFTMNTALCSYLAFSLFLFKSFHGFLPQRKWQAVSKEHMLSGKMAKFWISVHASRLRAESDSCELDVPGPSTLFLRYPQSEDAKLKQIFFGMMLVKLWVILPSQVVQRRRRGSPLSYDRQLQSLPQRGAQESWNSSTGKWREQKLLCATMWMMLQLLTWVFLLELGCCWVPDPRLPKICVCGKFTMRFSWWQGLTPTF